jgi:hypothetical protein
MKTNDRARTDARDRAGRRLRTMTIGAAILGVAATGALGWVAAGTPVGAGTTLGSTAVTTTNASNAGTGGSTQSAPTVTGAAGRTHATTGSS